MKLSTLTATLALSGASSAASPKATINYSTVQGYFLQDDPATDPSTFDYASQNFGLLNRTYDADTTPNNHTKTHTPGAGLTQWQRFHRQLTYLNTHSPASVSYKLFFLGRHGEGWHNAAEDYYGTPAWNCYYSLLDGNGTNTWFDADLTPAGVEQAQIAAEYWLSQHRTQKIHLPDVFYSSPMTRALRTANITFSDNPLLNSSFVPLVKEGFREGISLHTCDARRTKSYIQTLFPAWNIEEGFSEEDELWTGVLGETSEAQDARSKRALDDIFDSIPNTFSKTHAHASSRVLGGDMVISVTAHSGEISSILRVIGHQEFSLSTGAVIPVLIRAEEVVEGDEPSTTSAPSWTVSAHCTAPPVTSTASRCVCASSAAPVTTGLVVATGGYN